MAILGYVSAIFIGITLGLIGGGGSILTVPLLVYMFGVDPLMATVYSLFIVGITSVFGASAYVKKGLVAWKTVILFGIPSVVSVVMTKQWLLQLIPDHIFQIGDFSLTKSGLLMLLFAVLMLFSSYRMISKNNSALTLDAAQHNGILKLVLQGLFVGLITGLVGAGGGFLIIPALVGLLRMPIKSAVASSLVIIAINSLTGFAIGVRQTPIDWTLVLSITTLAIVGSFIGTFLSSKIASKQLKPAFGWFVLVMGIYIMLKEILIR